MPQTAIDILNRFGLGVAILAAACWFLVKHWWPYFIRQRERIDKERRDQLEDGNKERRETLGKMTNVLSEHAAAAHQQAVAFQAVVNQLRDLTAAVEKQRPRQRKGSN